MVIGRWRERARLLKREVFALAIAYRHPRTPWLVRLLTLLIVAYALSPVDLIPDFVPLFGYLDDVILLPMGIALVLRFIPPEVMAEARQTAATDEVDQRLSRLGLLLIGGIWFIVLCALVLIILSTWG